MTAPGTRGLFLVAMVGHEVRCGEGFDGGTPLGGVWHVSARSVHAFWGRFFEKSGYYAHIVTLMHVPVARAACGLKRPGAAPAPAGMGSPPPTLGPPARVRARSGPWAAGPG